MKLQKLVYIAHGWMLGITGNPLIKNRVEAWQWGPVIPDLYHPLKKYGSGIVDEPLPARQTLEAQSAGMLISAAVWAGYGELAALQLSAITHAAVERANSDVDANSLFVIDSASMKPETVLKRLAMVRKEWLKRIAWRIFESALMNDAQTDYRHATWSNCAECVGIKRNAIQAIRLVRGLR